MPSNVDKRRANHLSWRAGDFTITQVGKAIETCQELDPAPSNPNSAESDPESSDDKAPRQNRLPEE